MLLASALILVFPAVAAARVVVVADGDNVTLFDQATRRALAHIDVGGGPTRAVAMSSDGARAFVLAGTTVATIDLRARTVTGSVVLATKARALAIAPNGERLYVARGGAVEALDAATLAPVASIALGDRDPSAIAVSADGTRGVVVVDRRLVGVFDPQRVELRRRIRLTGATGVAFAPSGAVARIASTTSRGARLVALDTRRRRPLSSISLGTRTSAGVALTCDGRRAIVGAGVGSLRSSVVDLQTGRIVRRLLADGNGPVFGVATGDDGRVFLGGRGVGVSVFSGRTYRRLPSLILGEGRRGYGIAALPGGRCPTAPHPSTNRSSASSPSGAAV